MTKKITDRLIAVLLVMTMILSLGVSSVASETQTTEEPDKALAFFQHLGAINNVTYEPDREVTRGEFAAIISNLLRIEYEENETAELEFVDIDEENPYVNEINAIIQKGYMNGISSAYFAPDNEIILVQAVKVIVDMLGYRAMVLNSSGYPDGYQAMAENLGLTKGMTKNYTDTLTQRDLAKLIYNALDTQMLVVDMSQGPLNLEMNQGDTFLTRVLKLNRVTGILTDNGITTMYDKTGVAPNHIKIDNLTVAMPEAERYVQDYIGRSVTAYVTNDDEEATLVYAALSGKDQTESFDIEDFEGYTSTAITYNNGTKSVTRVLSDNAVMIYNGMAEQYFDETTFNFDSGKVTLVSHSGSIDLILVEKHDYIHVSTVDYENQGIYSSLLGTDRTGKSYDLKQYDYVTIFDAEGNVIALNSIGVGNILDICENAPAITIKVKNEVVDGFTVRSIRTEDGVTYISDGNAEYKILNEYTDSPYTRKIEMGNTLKLYIGNSNLVVWVENSTVGKDAGFVIRTAQSEDDEEVFFVKMYTRDGKIQQFTLKKKVKVLDPTGKDERCASTYVYNQFLMGYTGLVKYSLDKDGLIDYIEFPTPEPNSTGQLFELYDQSTDNGTWTGDGGYNGIWFHNADTVFMKIPNDLGDTTGYANITESQAIGLFGRDNQRACLAYASEPNTAIAEYVLFMEEVGETPIVGSTRNFVVVDEIYEELNEYDEIIQIVKGTRAERSYTQSVTLYSKMDAVKESDGSAHSAFENVTDTMRSTDSNGQVKRYNVQKGDIIRCVYDDNGYVSIADITWRMTEDNPTSANGKKGWLLGSNGYHRSTSNTGNPYGINGRGGLEPYHKDFMGNQGTRITYGSVIKKEGSIVHLTTADLTDPAVSVDSVGDYARYNVNISYMVVMDCSGRTVTSRVATADDIKSYEQVGKECSRVLCVNYWGVYVAAVIINGGSY